MLTQDLQEISSFNKVIALSEFHLLDLNIYIHQKFTDTIFQISDSIASNDNSNSYYIKSSKLSIKEFNKLFSLNKKKKIRAEKNYFFLKNSQIRAILQYNLSIPESTNNFSSYLTKNTNKILAFFSLFIKQKINLEYAKYLDYIKNILDRRSLSKNEIDISYQYYKSKILSELFNTLKHEISNPLFGINALAQITQLENPDLNQFVDDISLKSKQAMDIIKNCGQYYNNDSSANLQSLLKQTIIMLKSSLKDTHYSIINDINSDFILNINKPWFIQIITNLILNAVEATINQQVRLIQIKTYLKDNYFYLSIIDNGDGLEDKVKDKIFDCYYTTKTNGTGLGLYISKNLALKMNCQLLHKQSLETKYSTEFILKMKVKH